jgi:simple sugar transport system permease protein
VDIVTSLFFWTAAVRLAAPVLIAAIGETVGERAGVFNVGIEGMMLIGAFVGVGGTILTGSTVAGAISAVVITAILGILYGVVVAAFRADQVVTGIGFNILALGVTSLLRSTWLASRLEPSPPGPLGPAAIPGLNGVPFFGQVLFEQSPIVYIALLSLPIVAFYLFKTRSGLLLRAVGEQASAADSTGVKVIGVRVGAMCFACAMAGLAGAYLSIVATSGVFIENMTLGRGFLAIAVTIFGRWNPFWIAAAAVLFGAAEALLVSGQLLLGGSISPPLLMMAPFLLAIVAWALMGTSKGAPADLGRPFLRSDH